MNMKQKIYSLIILSVTFTSIEVMALYNGKQYSYGEVIIPDEKLQVSNLRNNGAVKKENEKESKNSVKTTNSQVDKSNETEQSKVVEQVKQESSNLAYNNALDESIYNSDDSSISDNQTAPAVSIFKVDKDTIPNKISIQDKAKLIFIARKLSVADCDDIKNDLNSSDEIGASKDIFTILKKRLSSKDYNNVKKILNPYINIDYIDENIDN